MGGARTGARSSGREAGRETAGRGRAGLELGAGPRARRAVPACRRAARPPRPRPQRPRPDGQSAGDLPALARPGRARPAGRGAAAPLVPGGDRAPAARRLLVRRVRTPAVRRGPDSRRRVHGGPAQHQRREPRPCRHRTRAGRDGSRTHSRRGADGPGRTGLRSGAGRGLPPPRDEGHGRTLVEAPPRRRAPGGHQAERCGRGLGPGAQGDGPYAAGRGRRVRRPSAVGQDRPDDRPHVRTAGRECRPAG